MSNTRTRVLFAVVAIPGVLVLAWLGDRMLTVSTTMGPGVKLDTLALRALIK